MFNRLPIKSWVTGLLLCALMLTGCGADNPLQEGINAAIDLNPKKPQAGQDVFFGLTLTEKHADIDIEGATVTMTLKQQEQEGASAPADLAPIPLQEVEPGRYTGIAVFPKPGRWVAHVTAEKEGETAMVDVEMTVAPQ